MRQFLSWVLGLSLTLLSMAFGQTEINIDRTCANCSRLHNDSVNVFERRAIRVNQVGYLPAEKKKAAYIAASTRGAFKVINAMGQLVFTDTLKYLGIAVSDSITAKGYSNYITLDYTLQSPAQAPASLYLADFGKVQTAGEYRIVHQNDTSATFWIHPLVYNKVTEKVLFFFGAQRCGNTESWFHQACHLKDGSSLGEDFTGHLVGGWHDCGDHGKYAETTAYTTLMMALAYSARPTQAEDNYASNHSQKQPDGIPDLLDEAKIGADFIYKLYAVSKEKGWLDSGDMAHSVGMGPGADHLYWGLPEKQDALSSALGGGDRPVTRGIGANVAGSYVAGLALFAKAWKSHDSALAEKMLSAAIDIYDRIVMVKRGKTTQMPCCYTGGGPTADDEAVAAMALWFATEEPRFRFDLLENTALGQNPLAKFNAGDFPAGLLANTRAVLKGGWPTDYGNIHSLMLYGLAKLILPDLVTASRYGVSSTARDSLLTDIQATLRGNIRDGSNGSNSSTYLGIQVDPPYNLLFISADWGFNRYNLGTVIELFLYYDLTRDEKYREVGVDNLNYLLGGNPYDISFVNGCGDRNLQHTHHRASNPDGLNQADQSYAYRPLTGAVLGGARPGMKLKDEWQDYTSSETCIDFAAQVILPLMILSDGDDPVVSLKSKPHPRRQQQTIQRIPKGIEITGRKSKKRLHAYP